MSLADNYRILKYVSDGKQVEFPVLWRFFDPDTVLVRTYTKEGLFKDQLSYGKDYSVVATGEDTGRVTLSAPVESGLVVTIYRLEPYVQLLELLNSGKFDLVKLEETLDHIVMLTQQNRDDLLRCLKVPPASDMTPEEFIQDLLSKYLEILEAWQKISIALQNLFSQTIVPFETVDGVLEYGVGEDIILDPDANNLLLSLGGVVQEPDRAYTIVDKNHIRFAENPGTGLRAWGISCLSFSNPDIRAIVQKAIEKIWAEANKIIATDAFVVPGTTEARNLLERFGDWVNVKDFGAKGDGVTDDSEAIQKAVEKGGNIYAPKGVYIISRMIRIPSNTKIVGAGIGVTVFKAALTTPRWTTLFHTGSPGDKRENIVIMDMTIDGVSLDRLSNPDGVEGIDWAPGCKAMRGSNLTVCNSERVSIDRVHSINSSLHCLDITGGSYYGSGTTIDNGDAFSENSEPSRDIVVSRCFFEGGSDDNLTTHQCSDIVISDCVSRNPRGIVVNNSNAYEIDDGSRNVIISGCIASGAYVGLYVKAHKGQAAPYNVSISDVQIWNCAAGLYLSHISIETVGDAKSIFAAGGKNIVDASGSAVNIFGRSPTGRNVRITNVSVYAPKNFVAHDGTVYNASNGVLITRYSDVVLSNITVSEGYYATGTGYDYEPADQIEGFPFAISVYAENVTARGINIIGFKSRIGEVTADYLKCAMYIGNESKNISVRDVSIRESRTYGFVANDADGLTVDNIVVMTEDSTNNLVGILINGPEAIDSLGTYRVIGYRTPVKLSNQRAEFSLLSPRVKLGSEVYDAETYTQRNIDFYTSDKNTPNKVSRINLSLAENGLYGSLGFYPNGKVASQLFFNDDNIACRQTFKPHDDNQFYCGTSNFRWSALAAATSSIITSDAREKQAITNIEEAVLRAWEKVEYRHFLFNDAVAKKGIAARIHMGMIAQQVIAAFESEGLDATRYGLLCYDKWDEQKAVLNENGEQVVAPSSAGDRYGIRYEEALCLEAAYQRYRADKLEERLSALEKIVKGE